MKRLLLALTLVASITSATETRVMPKQVSELLAEPAVMTHFKKLTVQAETDGKVSVIVGMKVAYAPEHRLSASSVKVQRAEVSNTQESVAKKLASKMIKFKLPYAAVSVTPAELQLLSKDASISSIYEDKKLYVNMAESAPLMGSQLANSTGFSGAGSTVAVLDTGVDKTHPFFQNRIIAEACFSSAGSDSLCPGSVASSTVPGSGLNCTVSESCFHGTHVAGTVAGYSSTMSGVAPGAQLLPVQVFSQSYSTGDCGATVPCIVALTSNILAALEHVYSVKDIYSIASVNLSIGGGDSWSSHTQCVAAATPAVEDAFKALTSAGVAVVVAAGNLGNSWGLSWPGCLPSAVSVGATYDYSGPLGNIDTIATFSNFAGFLSLLAPGSMISSSAPGGGYTQAQGTSMATPHVAGAWAVLKSAQPSLTVAQALDIFRNTGKQVIEPKTGFILPRINLAAALAQVNGQFHPLSVNAQGATVDVASNQSLYSGTTPYKTAYSNLPVALTAPSTASGKAFNKWLGCSSTSGLVCNVSGSIATVTAVYGSATTSQQITFPSLSNVVLGFDNVLNATASSGLPVTYTSMSPNCTIRGKYVTGVLLGNCVVRASQEGSSSYAPADYVEKTFSVVKSSWVKVANNGQILPDYAILGNNPSDWACTKDTVSGLMWEVKTSDNSIRDYRKQFTNYNDANRWQVVYPTDKPMDPMHYPTSSELNASTNSLGLANYTNSVGLCGSSNWRVPNLPELQSLLNPSYQPTIDPKYFPNTGDFAGKAPDSVLWATNYTRGAWFLNSAVSFATTDTWEGNYGGMWYVRLVSGNVSSGAYKLDTKTSGTGTGIISSPHKDGEIICALPGKFQYSDYSFLCWGDYPRGTVMNLKATPDAGSSFAGWSGSCSGLDVCTITMDRNHDVVAIFNTGSTVVQNPQNINFVPPSVQLKVGGSAAFSVSATSGLPVTIVVTTPSICSVSGNTIYGNTVGDCMMQLYQNGDSNWLAATTLTTGLPVVSGTVLRMSQVINYSAPSSIVVGGVGNLTFNSSSGLPVTATTNSACNLSGSVLHGISAGVCSIQLNQAGDSNYYPASTVTATVSIISAAKQNQTINMNVSPQSPVTVGTIVSVFGNASSGLPVTITSNCSLSGNTLTTTNVGDCNIQFNQAGNSQYNSVNSSYVLSVIKANTNNINFAPPSKQMRVGETGEFYVSATSGLPVAVGVNTPSICSVSGNTLYGVSAGDCILTLSQNGNSTYPPAPQLTTGLAILPSLVSGAIATTLSASTTESYVGNALNIMVFFKVSSSSGIPTGSVLVYDNGVEIADAWIDPTTGVAAISTLFNAGTHVVSATYKGDAKYAPSTYTFTKVVGSAAAALHASTKPNLSQIGEAVRVQVEGGNATVSSDGSSCKIVEPNTSCELVFNTKGVKRITASTSDSSVTITHFVGKRPDLTNILALLLLD